MQHLGAHHRRDRIAREIALVVFEHLQIEAFHPAVGGVHQPGIDEAVADGVVDQAGVHLADLRAVQRHVVQRLHRLQAVRAAGKLQVQPQQPVVFRVGFTHLFHFGHQLRHGANLLFFRALALHGEGVSVVHVRRLQPHQAELGVEFFHRVVSFLRRHALIDVVKDDQRCAGVFPGHVDLFVDHRVAGDHRGQIGLGFDLKTFGPQVLHGDRRQNALFGKVLARQRERGGPGGRAGHQQGEQQRVAEAL